LNSGYSLYIHIPFCNSFCDYCDFYSITTENKNDDYINAYLSALVKDIKNQITRFSVKNIVTAYIGGGTPSVLGKKICFLLDELNKMACFKPAEFTIEANPESITGDFLHLCQDSGINRLSLGVQTLHEPSRKAVNRKGELKIIEENIALAAKYFKDLISFDLIAGLPYQNDEILISDINRLVSYEPSHFSLYSMTIEDGTALNEKIKDGIITIEDRDKTDSIWLCGRQAIKEYGYKQYEVSNFAKEGRECVHNMRYWQMNSWMGAGAAACGTIINNNGTARRFSYASDVDAYIKNPSIDAAFTEEINKDTFMKESLMMGFRCLEGPNPNVFFNRFGISIEDCISNTLLKYKERDKMMFLNSFLTEAFSEIDNLKL